MILLPCGFVIIVAVVFASVDNFDNPRLRADNKDCLVCFGLKCSKLSDAAGIGAAAFVAVTDASAPMEEDDDDDDTEIEEDEDVVA